jgi:acetylornithine deacetylase
VQRDAYSATHENLLVSVPGADGGAAGATLFESHVDTVPADDWADRAFLPEVAGDDVFGRGACDDKGSLVAMVLALIDIHSRGLVPPQPVLFMAAGDEEYAQTGIKHFRSAGSSPGGVAVARGVFGEPSVLQPIVQHNGTVRWDITVHGRSAHTSKPHLGVNAIEGVVDVLAGLRAFQSSLAEGHRNHLVTPPTLTVTMINGGRTRNAVPDECTIAVDYRVSPGNEPAARAAAVIDALAELGLELSHSEPQLMTPPLTTAEDDPFVDTVTTVCRKYGDAAASPQGVPYGTDASWVSDLGPSVVLGPGSIEVAHAIDEKVSISEVVAAAEIYRELMLADHAR